MARRILKAARPAVDRCEIRLLPSGILAVMASASSAHGHYPISTTSIALPTNQGPQGTNLALTPTGTPTAKELRHERFKATFVGTYTTGPGDFSSEAMRTRIKGAGGSNTILHGDLQLLVVTPKDPSTPLGGTLVIFDRNINSNSALGLDLTAPQANVDAGGRPNVLSVSLDANTSSGLYVEGYATGTVNITYMPSGKPGPQGFSQGKAIVRINAQVYTSAVDFILANANIDPGPAGKA
ncbi:MAG: hypothetical protein P4L84_06085 [Isosphaeraceae bacterium]|nr:hypothetical protein [Isosphaeraceae bacterium]